MSRSSLATKAVIVAAIAGVVAYFALGMPGMDHSTSNSAMPAGHSMLSAVSPERFASLIDTDGAFVVNVHVPYEGEIVGTDAFVDYRTILDDRSLPTDRSQPILLYCMSGRMSQIAGNALGAAGYTNITHLDGGMKAWERSDRTVEQVAGRVSAP